jgi:hypothetical protein
MPQFCILFIVAAVILYSETKELSFEVRKSLVCELKDGFSTTQLTNSQSFGSI